MNFLHTTSIEGLVHTYKLFHMVQVYLQKQGHMNQCLKEFITLICCLNEKVNKLLEKEESDDATDS